MLWSGAARNQKGSNGMWRTKVQICSEESYVHVTLGAIMVSSGIFSVKPSCVLGETWAAQSRRHWAEKSQALSPWRLRSLKPTIAVSFYLLTMASG